MAGSAPLRTLTLTGGPGIGKTALWEAGIEAARALGLRVLVVRASGAEARHSFAGLIDLFDGIALAGLPAPQRAALETALLRALPGDAPPPRQAIALAVLNQLRLLSPLLVAIDDVQWLDSASADALAFAVPRLAGAPVAFLLARRPGSRSSLEQVLAPERVEVGPLDFDASRRLLAERLGLGVPRPLMRRIADTTLGNPLFTLEVGRALIARGLPEIGQDLPLPDAVEEMLGTRVAALPDALRRVLLAVALSGDLRADDLSLIGDVEDAVDAGLVRVEAGRVRAAHPLLAAAARKHARPRERRELHRVLADTVAGEELRARHLALAAQRPDAALADTVAAAAAGAAARGAAAAAVELAEQALRLTPADRPERVERLLALAHQLETAGERRRVSELLTPELPGLPPGRSRVHAWLLLANGSAVTTYHARRAHVEHALAEAGADRALRAHALASMALSTAAEGVERLADVEAWAHEALREAAGSRSRVERLALRALAWSGSLRGRPIDDVCARFAVASETASQLIDSPEPVAALRLVWRGDLDRARETLTRHLALADERGESISYAWMRLNLCELGLRAADWETVARLLDEWAQSADEELLITPTYQRCRALVAAGRGLAGEARRWAAPALETAEPLGFRWQVLESRRALGIAALLAHEPALAAEHLRAVWEHTRREGVDEPGAFPVAPDLVAALVELGELAEAQAVADRLRDLAQQQEHPWGLASAKRCDALVAGSADAAALAEAAAAYERLGLRGDAAHTLLAAGRAQRRLKKWGAARASLEAAAAAFDALGSPGWAEEARSELARVGARRPTPSGELTAAERRVVELAAEGCSNKEIAQALFVSVRTVEAHLTHAYAKLGVRSRAQLARRLTA
jgi:DNA-binding CsgD family transcriptional regulator